MARPTIIDQILDAFLARAASGAWPEGEAIPSTRRLADNFGVCRRTMMRVTQKAAALGLLEINQRQGMVLAAGAIEEAARRLQQRRDQSQVQRIAILVSEVYMPIKRNVFYNGMSRAIIQEAERRGFEARVVPWPIRDQMNVVTSLPKKKFHAAIFLGFMSEYTAALCALHEISFPTLVFNRNVMGVQFPTVSLDIYAASQKIAAHFHQLGHRNVCMIVSAASHDERVLGKREFGKVTGWLDYLHEHDMLKHCIMPIYIPWGHSNLDFYNATFRHIMNGPHRPTAIVFAHSAWAKVFFDDPAFSYLKVPDLISLATFESPHVVPTVDWSPQLTHIEINMPRTAACVMENLQQVLGGNPMPPTIRVPFTIQLTDSVGPAPAGDTPPIFTPEICRPM